MQKLFALALLLALSACSSDAPTASLFERVNDLRGSGNYPDAIAEVRSAIRDDPNNPELRRLQGAVLLDAQDWSLAEIALRKAIELGAAGTEIQLEIAEALFMQDKFIQTRDLLSKLQYSSNRTEIEGDIRLAKALDKTRDSTRAKRTFSKILKKFDRKSLTYSDPIDTAEIILDLEKQRRNYTSLDAVFENRARLQSLPIGKWVMLHKQRVLDDVFFSRQNHGGSTFDTKRGQLVLFGSDTHDYGDMMGKNWKNCVFFFDPATNEWSQSYLRDPVSTYTVNADGIPVAGDDADHPWAMHTYGAVSYDAEWDQVIVSSYPAHLEPGQFTYMLQKVWPQVRRHPTWIFDLETNKWSPLAAQAESFFLHATTYDSDRSVIVGYRGDGVYELSGSPRNWHKVLDKGLLSPDINIVYDSKYKALIIFGGNGYTNEIVFYDPATKRHEKMPTPGIRPPKDRHVPMAFHSGIGKSVMLVQRRNGDDPLSGITETWVYDLGEDAWEKIETATLDFGVYRNYNLEYDPFHNLLLFVPNPYGQLSLTKVLALRL